MQSEFDVPNFAGEANAIKVRLLQQLQKQTKPIVKKDNKSNLSCSWCEELISEDHYYQCETHNSIFCDNCAHNFYETQIRFEDAPKCVKIEALKNKKDCIYKKRLVYNENNN